MKAISTMQRPKDTTAYAAGDGINTTEAQLATHELPPSGGVITGVRVRSNCQRQFRVWLFDGEVNSSSIDNAYLQVEPKTVLAFIDVKALPIKVSDDFGWTECSIPYTTEKVSWQLQTMEQFIPESEEQFIVELQYRVARPRN